MKKNILTFLSGIIIGALMFGTTLVFASDEARDLLVQYSNIKIVVNGKLVQSQLEPFTYQDRVFVPLRAVAEALQQQVGWEDNTVIITGGNSPKNLSLQDMFIPVKSGLEYNANTSMTINENEYKRGFRLTPTDKTCNLKYVTINSGLKQVSGSVALDDANKNNDTATLTILVDNKKAEKLELKKGDQPKPFQLDVADANEIIFRVEEGLGKKIDFLDMNLKY